MSSSSSLIPVTSFLPAFLSFADVRNSLPFSATSCLPAGRYDTVLAEHVARNFSGASGLPVDAASEVVLTCGQSGAFAATCLAGA